MAVINLLPLSGAAVGFFALSFKNALAALLCTIALCVFSTSLLRIPQWMHRAFPIFIAVMLVVATIVVLMAPTASGKVGAEPASRPGPRLQFLPLSSGTSPRCAAYYGTGQIADGHTLLIYDRAIDALGVEVNHDYTFSGQATKTAEGWTTPKIEHGSDYVEVVGVLTPDDVWEYMRSIYSPATGERISKGLRSAQLPPGDRVVLTSIRVDQADAKLCGK